METETANRELKKIVMAYAKEAQQATFEMLISAEERFPRIDFCKGENYSNYEYEINLAGGGPLIYTYVDNFGHSLIDGFSASVGKSIIENGRNIQLNQYIEEIKTYRK